MRIASHAKHKHTSRRMVMPAAAIVAVLALALPFNAMADSGVDVSNWQGCVNAPRAQSAKSAGTSFGIVKATEGTGFTDNTADCTMTGLAQAGIRRAVYHFARPEYGNSPEAEADWFLSQTRGYVSQGVLPILDWEPGGGQKGNVAWAKRWLDRVAAAWGTKPLIYMSASTISAGDWTPVARADYGLWVAGYPNGYAGDRLRDPGAPPYPLGPWPFAAAWQYSSSGSVPGIGERIDVDWFYGDAVTWSKYANAPLPAAPAVTPSRPVPAPVQSTPKGDASIIASAVIRGEYGNDPQRHALLGSRYGEIMAVVNRRLSGTSVTGSSYYTVRSGDYLSKIWPSTWPTVAALNGLRPPYVIYVGQRLRTSGSTATASAVTSSGTYRIQSGDTLGKLATRWGASVSYLARINHITNINRIYAGQTLRH